MKFYSLNRQSDPVSFKEACIRGQAPDKGLYFPERIPLLSDQLKANLRSISNEAIALEVIRPYIGNSIPDNVLRQIVEETVNFDIPLVAVTESVSSLELFHGPTLAFKDVGARFMSRCLGYFSREEKNKIVVLVATSGDTGGAVAHGFYGVEGVDVVILYPSGKVSSVQEKQLTALGKNIHALEVQGSFDDCQQMVKQAFADDELRAKRFLTSANSINVARWLPQQFYYFFALKQWPQDAAAPVFSVPSGNFGNICAGILAHLSGLPARHFLAACNANDVVPRFLQSQDYQPRQAIATISNAMDVGNPSNFIRILELFHQEFSSLTEKLSSCSISDDETRATIRRVYQEYDYLLDPHGAVGFLALERYLQAHPDSQGILLETAHPVKFYDVVEPLIGEKVPLPNAVKEIMQLPKKSTLMPANYDALKEFLFSYSA